MTDHRAGRLAEFIKPLRVKPGSKVDLARDFDPGYKADFLSKKEGAELLRAGIELLAGLTALVVLVFPLAAVGQISSRGARSATGWFSGSGVLTWPCQEVSRSLAHSRHVALNQESLIQAGR